MRKLIFIFLTLTIFKLSDAFAQSKPLTDEEKKKIFDPATKEKLNIDFPIFRVYAFQDKLGEHYLVLTEHPKDEAKQTNDAIKGYCFLKKNWQLEWQLKDFLITDEKHFTEEGSIWFWTKYLNLEDLDKDGRIEPIIVYGTSGINGQEDGRIKILTYYKGEKKAIRHQNSTLDFQRATQIDESFYNLPVLVQQEVKDIIQTIEKNNHGLLSTDWQKKMSRHSLRLDDH